MSSERTSFIAGAGLTLVTAAAAELGAPEWVWIGAGILGALSFVAALLLHVASRGSESRVEVSEERQRAQRPPLDPAWREVTLALVALSVVGAGLALLLGVDISPQRGNAVIVCIDSTVSTDRVRRSYMADLRKVVHLAALRRANFYAADCGANATGSVNWPVRKQFGPSREELARAVADLQAEDVSGELEDLIGTSSSAQGTSLGEVLAVMARQCDQTGNDCAIYFFTDGAWSDAGLRVRDGVTMDERRNYLKTYLPQLQGLAGSQVNFVGVGYGTSIGEMRLGEAREAASALVEGAEADMGAWTTRL